MRSPRLRYFLTLAVVTAFAAHAQDPAPAPAAPAPAPEAAPAAPGAPAPLTDIRQVQIQVWISETSEQGLRDIGANLNYTRFVRGEEQSGSLQQISTNVFDPVGDFGSVTLPAPTSTAPSPPYNPPNTNPAFPAPLRPDESGSLGDGVQSRSGVGLTANIINPGYGTVDGVFRAIEDSQDVELISKPEILVVNNEVATINAGGQVPYQAVTYDKNNMRPQLNVTWEKTGVNMALKPHILPDNMIELEIQKLDVTELLRTDNVRGLDLPVFSSRSQTGFVLVPSGETLVIGGLTSRVVRRTERRVPVVGTIPILGMPFRSRRSEADVTTLLIFVSPTIVDQRNLSRQAINALSFWQQRGAEWANIERIERETKAMEDDL